MPIDVNKVLDYEFKTIDFDWDADKVILYHLGVGAGADWLNPDELRYTFEKNLHAGSSQRCSGARRGSTNRLPPPLRGDRE